MKNICTLTAFGINLAYESDNTATGKLIPRDLKQYQILITNDNPDILSLTTEKRLIRQALAEYEKQIGYGIKVYTELDDEPALIDIWIDFRDSDPYFTSNILAYAGYPNGSFKGKLVFNNKHIWLDGYNISGKRAKELGLVENALDDSQLATFNVRQTVKHEMGHILGLEHNAIEEPSVMNAYYGKERIMFGEKDKETLNLKYGKASYIKRAKPDPWIKDIMLRKL